MREHVESADSDDWKVTPPFSNMLLALALAALVAAVALKSVVDYHTTANKPFWEICLEGRPQDTIDAFRTFARRASPEAFDRLKSRRDVWSNQFCDLMSRLHKSTWNELDEADKNFILENPSFRAIILPG